ncbi:hypothetical protein ACJ73_06856 [Blastomyces percursus]|uniref:Uncharacterized protein n=1 Tax=Blastomyces percursus TaxID=1658174 RepID=A0A1J9Q112_9EURO|nr:hypothetical protein ACJ73_06856 [Blastomyces percursus]
MVWAGLLLLDVDESTMPPLKWEDKRYLTVSNTEMDNESLEVACLESESPATGRNIAEKYSYIADYNCRLYYSRHLFEAGQDSDSALAHLVLRNPD